MIHRIEGQPPPFFWHRVEPSGPTIDDRADSILHFTHHTDINRITISRAGNCVF
jgi:hypothetical protein